MKKMKITDKSLNLDVQGQGCFDDCHHQGYWSNQIAGTNGCYYVSQYFDAKGVTIGGINFGILM